MLFKDKMDPESVDNVTSLLTRAFPTEFEAHLVENLRRRDKLSAEHSLWHHGQLIGYIAYSPVSIEGVKTERILWGLGPMAIDPEFQGEGYGLKLLKESFEETHADALVVLGHVGFYKKIGFAPAAHFGLTYGEAGVYENAFMALECWAGALDGLKGHIVYDPAFYEG